jgi:alginate O-acetyltransferase complex protein AlgI
VLLPLGFSFVVFRCVHVLVEVYRGSIGSLRAWDLAAYVFFFPAFLAGPLERFPRFVQQSRASAGLQADDVRAGLLRMLVGALRKVVVAPLLAQHVRLVLGAPHEHAPLAVLAAVYGTALWLYMDFAGYTDMALGLARLLGYRLVENFDRPFLAGNIAVFWRRWHISLYAFIRDYFFWPLFGTRPSRLLTAVGVVCTMLVFMLWHGAEPRWLVLGLYHGLALVLWSLLQDAKAGRPRLRRALSSAPGRALAWLLTFHFVACGFLLFFYDLAHARAIVGRLVSAAAGPAAW